MNIDMQWGSNYKIAEGDLFHKKVDDPFFNEKRKDVYVSRSEPVFSKQLNIYGIADIVEFLQCEKGITLKGKTGFWKINPIEYKNGQPEENISDNYQLCAVALCLEEMFNCNIESGDIFYGKLKRRKTIKFDKALRQNVALLFLQMETIIHQGEILQKKDGQNCNLCSLVDICQPNVAKSCSMLEEMR